MIERKCYGCGGLLGELVDNGISRWVCTRCPIPERPTRRPYRAKRMKVWSGVRKVL